MNTGLAQVQSVVSRGRRRGATKLPAPRARPEHTSAWLKWLPAAGPPALAAAAGGGLPGWVFMWLMALALLAGAKWITLCRPLFSKPKMPLLRLAAYAFLWPGLDPAGFCAKAAGPAPAFREWALGAGKTLAGAVLIWLAAPAAGRASPLAAGWLAMFGAALLLHFGVFHLLSNAWRALGLNARPLMRSPAASVSLQSFWGGRWNRAFADLVHAHFLVPLARRAGSTRALFAVFLLSGLLHELVISLPARGGYGLPTLYFLLQAAGMLIERCEAGVRLGLGRGWKGWCFVLVVAGVPAFWLFPPVFVRRVILPMLRDLGAT